MKSSFVHRLYFYIKVGGGGGGGGGGYGLVLLAMFLAHMRWVITKKHGNCIL